MEEIVVEGLDERLITLSVARDRLERALDNADRAESPYRFAIKLIESAMGADQAVVDAREKLATMRQIEEDATRCVSKAAISAWQDGLTEGRKEWVEGGFAIRLRTTLTPVVTHIENFIAFLVKVGATGIIKRVVLNRKAATDLDRCY